MALAQRDLGIYPPKTIIYYNLKNLLRNFLGKSPFLFYLIYSVYPVKNKNLDLLTNLNTQLVIEGFPRSANTFAVITFWHLQPKKVIVAHHQHVPAQIIRAVNLFQKYFQSSNYLGAH